MGIMSQRTLPAGFIAPSLPIKITKLPSGSQWLHEIKHEGFRIIARKSDGQVKLYSRPGNDFTRRFPLILEALAGLRSGSCIIDGEAVACDNNSVALFDLIRHHRANGSVFLYAFDLIELNGDDLRRDPLQVRKATLASILSKARPGIRFNEHIEGDGPTVLAPCLSYQPSFQLTIGDEDPRFGRFPPKVVDLLLSWRAVPGFCFLNAVESNDDKPLGRGPVKPGGLAGTNDVFPAKWLSRW
jgi:bifunctional non-homologous end joining protein LigD